MVHTYSILFVVAAAISAISSTMAAPVHEIYQRELDDYALFERSVEVRNKSPGRRELDDEFNLFARDDEDLMSRDELEELLKRSVEARNNPDFSQDERVLCFHGPLLYEATVLKIENQGGWQYFVHYKGWKQTWDEWVPSSRVLKFSKANIAKGVNGVPSGKA